MKKLGFLMTFILILTFVLSACAATTPAAGDVISSTAVMTEILPVATEAMTEMMTETNTETMPAPTEVMTETSISGDEVEIKIKGFAFLPGDINIKVGTTVKWKNEDSAAHTATDEGGAFNSGSLSKGKSYSFTFTKEGVYRYFCKFHPDMVATITVTK